MNLPDARLRQLAPHVAIVAIAFLFLLPLLGNPGFFSHDEWQKLDEIQEHGLADYFARYTSLPLMSDFAQPVRPVAFAVQGFAALFMLNHAWVVHFVDVAMHTAAACLLFAVLRRFSGGGSAWPVVSAAIFAVSPLAMPSVVWPAALMDRLYVVWGLAALLATHRYVVEGGSRRWLVGAGAAVLLAVLSKETAVVLPGALLVWLLFRPDLLRARRFWQAFAAWCVPAALFMAYRLPALVGTLTKGTVSLYSVSPRNIPEALGLYVAFPFLERLVDTANWSLIDPMAWQLAFALHALLALLLLMLRGWRALAAYAALYVVFLLPVLPISGRGGQYLYGSGLAFAAALGALATSRGRGALAGQAVAALALGWAVLHSIGILLFAYDVGACTQRIQHSALGAWMAGGRPAALHIEAEPGAREWMLHRLFTTRKYLGTQRLDISIGAATPPPGAARLKLAADCTVWLDNRSRETAAR
jgi:hypothetical protein